MGFDLYSKRKPRGKDPLYYRFNIHGWGCFGDFLDSIGCSTDWMAGSNDGDLCEPDSCIDVADHLDRIKAELSELMTCKDIVTHVSDDPLVIGKSVFHNDPGTDIKKYIVEQRLKNNGKPLDVKLLKYNESCTSWTPMDQIAYYLGFADFCRGCAKLGGFEQW